jgi:putative transposase
MSLAACSRPGCALGAGWKGNRQDLTNREKTLLVDALRPTYGLAELLFEVGLPRSSYSYHRARLQVVDKY